MQHRQAIAVEIALQTHVLQTCPVHNQIFCDDDVDPSSAFALALELVRQDTPFVDEFHHDPHALTDLLSETIGAAPTACPLCAAMHQRAEAQERTSVQERTGVHERGEGGGNLGWGLSLA